MASEIRVNKINSRTGVGTITLSPTGVDFTGIATVATLKATTGIVTTLSATGDVDIADKIVHTGDTNTAIRFPAADTFTVETSGSERLRITSAGKIGIGNTTSPTADLEVAGTTGTASTIFVNAPTHSASKVSQSVLKFGYAHSGSPNAVAEIKLTEDSTNSFNGNLTFGVPSNNGSGGSSTSEALRIKSNGNIGIGTNSPSTRLDVEGNGVPVEINSANSNSKKVQLLDAGTVRGYFGASSTASFLVSGDGGSEQFRVQAAGGISFNADTAAANALDDYEEGTWTVTLAPGSGFTPTSNTSTGYYTKIGRQVTVIGRAVMTIPSSLGSYVNNNTGHGLAVSGLPFTSINASSQGRSAPVIGVSDNVGASDGVLAGHGTANSTQFSIYVNKDNGGTRVSPNLTASETVAIHFCFTYIV